ncbi:Crp/Fnr family transcriptional regulator [Desulfosarcina ovata]|uniref:Transcriptional regulator n=2 Tax=Desulfosarcina ovata TaxID=83564 RepID=A0A5K8AKU8_9BACT|nr:Crp/Fnr family transcriptional regulator [Desulfosarcina ovata]BBO86230.1 transcriptional regulator [Desulfosarcina ovata subsp. sediminis]BBO93126.1 transcriptional regulator [Desulfosarcina ovata subsp. ovata]
MTKPHADIDRIITLFGRSDVMKGIPLKAQEELAGSAVIKRYEKNDVLSQAEEPCESFVLVEEGMIRVSRYSPLGKRLTYLLAGPGEPINLVGPFTGEARANVAEAAAASTVVSIERKDFIRFAFAYPQLIVNIIDILGQALDSSNSRILDMQEKKVVQRLKRVLHRLSEKFGPLLNFTAVEIADLASTTTESALRVLSDLRQKGIIEKSRGQIHIIKPEALIDPESEELWI